MKSNRRKESDAAAGRPAPESKEKQEAGRSTTGRWYRTARDATGIDPESREPIDEESPRIPPD